MRELERFLSNYDPGGVNQVYEVLAEGRKVLIDPIKGSAEEMIRQWDMISDDNTAPCQEKRIYDTEQGELVRSKSEVIIANALYYRRNDLRYKYEPQLVIVEKRKKIII